MKIVLITDLHFGARNDSLIFSDHFAKFYKHTFFPYLQDNRDIMHLVNLGDTFDRRKYINFRTLVEAKKMLFDPLAKLVTDNALAVDFIVGNHDCPMSNHNNINALYSVLNEYSTKFNYHTTFTQVSTSDDTLIDLIPWICDENRQFTLDGIKHSTAQIAFGHLQLLGFQQQRGIISDHGDSRALFDKYQFVASGHYHHKSSDNNIHYLGCPYQIVWSDHGSPKGFHVFDTITKQLQFIANPHNIFEQIIYNDSSPQFDPISNYDQYSRCYVKIFVEHKTNPYMFDIMISGLEQAGVADIQIIDDCVTTQTSTNIIQLSGESTPSVIRRVVDALDVPVDKDRLNALFVDLYNQAEKL